MQFFFCLNVRLKVEILDIKVADKGFVRTCAGSGALRNNTELRVKNFEVKDNKRKFHEIEIDIKQPCSHCDGKGGHGETVCDECGGEYLKVAHSFTIQDNSKPASEATCFAKATYYYTCECGAVGTKTYEVGDLKNHTYNYKGECVNEGCVNSIKVEGLYSDDASLYNYINKEGLTIYEINANSSLHVRYIENKDGNSFTHKVYDEDGNDISNNGTVNEYVLSKNQKLYVHINCASSVKGQPYFAICCDHYFDEYGDCDFCDCDNATKIELNSFAYTGSVKTGKRIFKCEVTKDTYAQLVFTNANNERTVYKDEVTVSVIEMAHNTPVTVYSKNKFELKAGVEYRIYANFDLYSNVTCKVSLLKSDTPAELKEKAFVVNEASTSGDYVVLSGVVLSGIIERNDELFVYNLGENVSNSFKVKVNNIKIGKSSYSSIYEGENVELYVETEKESTDFNKNFVLSTVEYSDSNIVTDLNFYSYWYEEVEGGKNGSYVDGYKGSLDFTFTVDNKTVGPINFGSMEFDFDNDSATLGEYQSGVIHSNDSTTIKWLPFDILGHASSKVSVVDSDKTVADLYLSENAISEKTAQYNKKWQCNNVVIRDGYFTCDDNIYSSLTTLYKDNTLSNLDELMNVSFYAVIDHIDNYDEPRSIATFACSYVYYDLGYALAMPTNVEITYIGISNPDTPEIDVDNYSISIRYTSGGTTYFHVEGIDEATKDKGCYYIFVL